MNFIAAKGKDEFGGQTKAETNFDGQIMYDVGRLMGSKGKFKGGFEYQYWKNKFGNDASGPAGSGAFAKTPMLPAEYHFYLQYWERPRRLIFSGEDPHSSGPV